MFEKISVTQTANYVAFIMFVVQIFKLNITNTEVETIVSGVLGIIAVAVAFVQRYKRGDISLGGVRKDY